MTELLFQQGGNIHKRLLCGQYRIACTYLAWNVNLIRLFYYMVSLWFEMLYMYKAQCYLFRVEAVKKLKRERRKSTEKKSVGCWNTVNILYVQDFSLYRFHLFGSKTWAVNSEFGIFLLLTVQLLLSCVCSSISHWSLLCFSSVECQTLRTKSRWERGPDMFQHLCEKQDAPLLSVEGIEFIFTS